MNERCGALCECRDCGLLQRLPEVPDGSLAVCSRCDALLHNMQRHTLPLSLACAGVGLALFALAFVLPVASVSMPGGRSATADLFTGPQLLRETGAWPLAVVVVLTLMVLPGFELLVMVAMAVGVHYRYVPRLMRRAFSTLPKLSGWAMVEVFMLGATIALVRLRDWMHVDFGLALFALGGVVLCSIGLDNALDRRALWARVPLLAATSRRASGSPFISCEGCELVAPSKNGERCRRCSRALHARKPDSIHRTWALALAAALLAIPANLLPVMTITKAGQGGPSTIIGGTIELVEHGFWPLAVLVFVASIVVPLLKLVALVALLIFTSRASASYLGLRTKVFRAVSFIGRWSMLDIFATMMLVELARFGWLGSVLPGTGATAFCGVVVLTMLASESFDPRLMWDAAGANHALSPATRHEWKPA